MASIIKSIYCIPCVWSILLGLGTFGAISYILNVYTPFRGPLPSDGPIEGFASKSDRITFYDTGPLRIRLASIIGFIGIVLWLIGIITALLILR